MPRPGSSRLGISAYLASLGPWITLLQGAIFVVCVLLFRQGICGWINERKARGEKGASGGMPVEQAVKPGYSRR